MNIGQMDRRITLQEHVATRAPNGEELRAWADVATVYAEKKYAKGSEDYQADQKQAVQRVVWRIRYRAGVTPLLRVVDAEGLLYQVEAVQEIGRRQGLLLNCYTLGVLAENTPLVEAAVPYSVSFTVA